MQPMQGAEHNKSLYKARMLLSGRKESCGGMDPCSNHYFISHALYIASSRYTPCSFTHRLLTGSGSES